VRARLKQVEGRGARQNRLRGGIDLVHAAVCGRAAAREARPPVLDAYGVTSVMRFCGPGSIGVFSSIQRANASRSISPKKRFVPARKAV
jgi:hypothetical protein